MSDVKAIPDGYPGVCPYITVDDCAKAIDYYCEVLGAEAVFKMTIPGTDMVAHAELRLGETCFMMGQASPEMNSFAPAHFGGSPVSMHYYVEDVDALFKKVEASEATIEMPPTDMFWGDRFAKFVDPFGHSWSIATHTKDLTPEEMEAGFKDEMAQGC